MKSSSFFSAAALVALVALPLGAEPLAQRAVVRDALAQIAAREPETLNEQVRLCEIPAPPFEEAVRAGYYRAKFVELGLQDVRIDAVGNVLGVRPGKQPGPVVVFSAHLDTVFPAGTDTRVTREGTIMKAPGIADDCRGLAVVLAVIETMQQSQINTAGTVIFVGTVGEEGLGDLRGVKHLFQQELAGQITHFISIDGTDLGTNTSAVGSYRYRVTFNASGGHSFGAFGSVNPIHALGRAIAKIGEFIVPNEPKTTYNVGRIDGGTSVNSIPFSAMMEVDMRSVDAGELDKLDAQFHLAIAAAVEEENAFWNKHATGAAARRTNKGIPLTADVQRVGVRPTGRVDEKSPILQAVLRADAALGIKSRFEPGSTDSNIPISLGIPAVTMRGGGKSSGAHSLHEQFDSTDSHLGTQRAFLALLEIVGLVD
ncbi:MAG: M20/M25/M40 family metallo-hydrolase [Candidatus Didemnitutus sp.]|nr:M20/M25/M40 family metallo-hydrolase [Candidatus Didemnitutus sp.]